MITLPNIYRAAPIRRQLLTGQLGCTQSQFPRLLGREALQTIWKPLNERLPPVLNKVVTSLYLAGVIGLDDHDDIVLRGRDTRRDVASLLSSLSRQLLDRVLQFAVVLQSIEGVDDLGVVLQEEVHHRGKN